MQSLGVQVFLRTSDGASNGVKEGTALVYAASWWNADAAHRYLQDEVPPPVAGSR